MLESLRDRGLISTDASEQVTHYSNRAFSFLQPFPFAAETFNRSRLKPGAKDTLRGILQRHSQASRC